MPLYGACCKLHWCEPVQARVRSHGIVVDPPCFDDPACFGQAAEQMFVETFVTQAAVEGFDEAVLRRFPRRDVMPLDLALFLPAEDRMKCQLRAVVADDHARYSAGLDDAVEFTGDTDEIGRAHV
mgnify:FL=1